jgi:hypothetical protein
MSASTLQACTAYLDVQYEDPEDVRSTGKVTTAAAAGGNPSLT